MIKWLIKCLWGCSSPCKYVTIERSNIIRTTDNSVIGTAHTTRCESCGHLKHYSFWL